MGIKIEVTEAGHTEPPNVGTGISASSRQGGKAGGQIQQPQSTLSACLVPAPGFSWGCGEREVGGALPSISLLFHCVYTLILLGFPSAFMPCMEKVTASSKRQAPSAMRVAWGGCPIACLSWEPGCEWALCVYSNVWRDLNSNSRAMLSEIRATSYT